MSHEDFVTMPVELLASIVGMAESYLNDIESGIEEGIYLAKENPGLEKINKS